MCANVARVIRSISGSHPNMKAARVHDIRPATGNNCQVRPDLPASELVNNVNGGLDTTLDFRATDEVV
jgi:hypothetical protein